MSARRLRGLGERIASQRLTDRPAPAAPAAAAAAAAAAVSYRQRLSLRHSDWRAAVNECPVVAVNVFTFCKTRFQLFLFF